jgi:hypothetical protein
VYNNKEQVNRHYKLVFVAGDVRNVHVVGRRTDIFLFGYVTIEHSYTRNNTCQLFASKDLRGKDGVGLMNRVERKRNLTSMATRWTLA